MGPGPLDVGPGTPLKFKSRTPESQSKFESGTPGPLKSVKMRPICDALHDLVPDVARFGIKTAFECLVKTPF